MSKVTILKCTCKHEYQDKVYGKQQRVHNAMKKESGGQHWRCTVCSKMKSGPEIKE